MIDKKLRYDLCGMRFGMLTVTTLNGKDSRGELMWNAICDCGRNKIAYSSSLRSGKTSHCGCMKSSNLSEANKKHEYKGTRLYGIWTNMKTRCTNPKTRMYPSYGGKGISVCDEWFDFLPFKDWAIKNGYTPILTIDRIDNSLGYNPSNCKFSTMKEQQNHRTNNRLLYYKGETYTMSQLSKLLCIKYSKLQYRMSVGKYPDGVSEVSIDR